MIVYQKIDEWYMEWQWVATNGTTSDNEWQLVTTNDEWYNEWQRVAQRVTTNDNEWQRMAKSNNEWQGMTTSSTTSDSEWLRVTILANFSFFSNKRGAYH